MCPQIKWVSLHPGVVQTGLAASANGASWPMRTALKLGRPFMMTVEKGVHNQLWASVSPDVRSGEYYEPVGVAGKGSDNSRNLLLVERLWQYTENELRHYGMPQ